MAQYKFPNLKAGYEALWRGMVVTKGAKAAAVKAAQTIIRLGDAGRYAKIQQTTGVPWFVTGLIHMRESNWNFATWLHNGDPMRDRNGRPLKTVRVPAGRPPNPAVDFDAGAYDAFVTLKGFDKIKVWGAPIIAYINESYNGFGYRHPARNIPSPYLWGGTNRQKRGKFVSDGVYDRNVWDTQLGVMAVLKEIITAKGITLPGDDGAPVAVPPASKPPASPKTDTPEAIEPSDGGVRPPAKSQTVWGSVLGWLSGAAGTIIATVFGAINNPYALAAFGTLIVLGAVFAFMSYRGYVDVRNVVKHVVDEGDPELDSDGDGIPDHLDPTPFGEGEG
jgi:lysozyme family protein